MSNIRFLPKALDSLDEIYLYTIETWGVDQADLYLSGLFKTCETLSPKTSRVIRAEFGVDGFVTKYQKHFIYWRLSQNDEIIVVCILHERMQQRLHILKEDFE